MSVCVVSALRNTVVTHFTIAINNDMVVMCGVVYVQDISIDLAFMSLCRLSDLGFLWLTNGGASLSDRYLSCQKMSLNTVFYIIPTPQEVQNLFLLNSSSAAADISRSIVHPQVKLLRQEHCGSSKSSADNGSSGSGSGGTVSGTSKRKGIVAVTTTTFHIRVQPSLRVQERVRRSVLQPMTPLVVTTINTTGIGIGISSTSDK